MLQQKIVNLKVALERQRKQTARTTTKYEELKRSHENLLKQQKQQLANNCSNNLYFDKLPVWKGVQVALRRGLTNVAAFKIGMILSMDIDGSTVCSWEAQTSACLIAASRSLHAEMIAINKLGGPFQNSSIIRIRCDATNAAVWQKQKLHVLEVRSTIIPAGSSPVSRTMLSDLLVVRRCDAVGMLQLIKTQTQQLGVPAWDSKAAVEDVKSFRAYVSCTDAGSDVKCARLAMGSSIQRLGAQRLLWCDIDCLQHQYALARSAVLKLAVFEHSVLRTQRWH